LIRIPDIKQKMLAEISNIVDVNGISEEKKDWTKYLTYENLANGLPYTTICINETLRIEAPILFSTPA